MIGIFKLDETDPVGRSYRRYWHKLKIVCVVLLILVLLAWLVGIPHLQCWTYTYHGKRPANGIPSAEQKLDAWYLSVTGWKCVRGGQYGRPGCPYILFIPVKDCIDFSRLKQLLTTETHNEGVTP